jgi:hypothetical protein
LIESRGSGLRAIETIAWLKFQKWPEYSALCGLDGESFFYIVSWGSRGEEATSTQKDKKLNDRLSALSWQFMLPTLPKILLHD